MANLKFWNIGKANERIDVLEKELAGVKAAAPTTDASLTAQLEEAKASNDQISQQLTKVEAEHKSAVSEIAQLKGSLEKAQGEVNDLGGKLKAACEGSKLKVKEGATSAELISTLQAGVSETLSKLHVSTADIPAGKPAANAPGAAKTELTGRARMLSAMRIQGVTPTTN